MLAVNLSGRHAGARHDERHPDRLLVEEPLAEQAVGTVHVSVIRSENHERSVLPAAIRKRGKHSPNLRINRFGQSSVRPAMQTPPAFVPVFADVTQRSRTFEPLPECLRLPELWSKAVW